jgi:hypothetical protein
VHGFYTAEAVAERTSHQGLAEVPPTVLTTFYDLGPLIEINGPQAERTSTLSSPHKYLAQNHKRRLSLGIGASTCVLLE